VSESGSVKFNCEHLEIDLGSFPDFAELDAARRRLRDLGLLSVDENGIGFGNVSVREGSSDAFFITGSGTGGLPALTPQDCARVTAWDFDCNWLRCEGRTIASAESLTHAAVYSVDRSVRVMLHGHSEPLWRALLECGPATRGDVAYGTPGMAREVQRLFRETDVGRRKLFAMAGHVNGFVAFGQDATEALGAILTQSHQALPPEKQNGAQR
jgi:ribulose-5-phosphate 4-epimerase/fuculose-1-phosphate aldolase